MPVALAWHQSSNPACPCRKQEACSGDLSAADVHALLLQLLQLLLLRRNGVAQASVAGATSSIDEEPADAGLCVAAFGPMASRPISCGCAMLPAAREMRPSC